MERLVLWLGGGVLGIALMALLINPFIVRVQEGKVAVVYTPNGGVTKTLDAGWHVKKPLDKITTYPVRVSVVDTKLTVTTEDGKSVKMPAKYELQVDPKKVIDIYKKLGSQDIETIQKNYLQQRLFKEARNIISEYTVLEVYGAEISKISGEVTTAFNESVEGEGFHINSVTLGTPELDEATQNQIDERVKASQANERKKIELENDKIEAERKREQAKGEADAMKIKAEGQAESNRILSESIDEKILKRQELDARQKHGWVTHQFGDNVQPVTDVE